SGAALWLAQSVLGGINAVGNGLGTYPDTGERAITPLDFVKYGLLLWVLSLFAVWILGFLGSYQVVGFPEGILETARQVLDSGGV
ncbi:MAG: hypothetical protein R6V55_06550, partial [Desulfovermiculus sp.]